MVYLAMRLNHIDHALAVGDVYFTLKPLKFAYEPTEEFEANGKKYVWSPDYVMIYNGKMYAGEVQLSPLSAKKWTKKWEPWNLFFKSKELFGKAKYQQWTSKAPVLPRFIAITKQSKAAEGFNIQQRELLVVKSVSEFIEMQK